MDSMKGGPSAYVVSLFFAHLQPPQTSPPPASTGTTGHGLSWEQNQCECSKVQSGGILMPCSEWVSRLDVHPSDDEG